MLSALNVSLGLGGMAFAYSTFAKVARPTQDDSFAKRLVLNKFYVDELYTFVVVRPLLALSRLIAVVIDPKVFDGLIGFLVALYMGVAKRFAWLQNGKVRYYALQILVGVSVMSTFILIKLGVLS
jgi:NADH-quinone oxidoreductase subunit L